jgi:3-carboxy-cis,cis-muconate cycloisomerase
MACAARALRWLNARHPAGAIRVNYKRAFQSHNLQPSQIGLFGNQQRRLGSNAGRFGSTVSIIDSPIFSGSFSTAETREIWSDARRTSLFLDFEAALAKVQAKLNIIPQKAADEIIKTCRSDFIDFDKLAEKTQLIGYPVLPVVQQLVQKVNQIEPKLGEWTHWGATTQDLTDTAVVLQLRDTLLLVESELDRITKALVTLCEKYKSTPMAARSNLQQAVPISFGFKMARLLATFRRHRDRLEELRPRLLILEFGGAAGTLATIPDQPEDSGLKSQDKAPLGLQCQKLLAEELGLAVPAIAWHTERDNFAEVANYLAILTGTCAKFATDLKLMMQSEVNEAMEPYVPHRGSSSTMPQKRNPIGSAYICAIASSVRTMAAGVTEGMVADHERSTGPWEIEWIMLPQICSLSHACLKHTAYLLEGLEVNLEGMAANLALSKGAIVSEAVMMGLGASIGRQYAHDKVYALCREAQAKDRPLIELLIEDKEIKESGVSKEELERLCDPARYLGLSEAMVDSVLGSIK